MIPGRVSVIIPTYNRPDYLPQTIESVLNQTYREIEILVIDDGSADEGAATQKALLPYFLRPNFTYIYQENGGTGAAVNRGLAQATGEYIQRLDDDDLLLPERILRCVEIFQKKPSVGMVATGYYLIDARGNRKKAVSPQPCPPHARLLSALMRLTAIPSAVMVKALVHQKIGGYRTDLEGTEDHEMWVRIARAYPIETLDEPLSAYRRHGGNLSHERNFAGFERGRLRFTQEYLQTTPLDELVPNLVSIPHAHALRAAVYLSRNGKTTQTLARALGEIEKAQKLLPKDPLLWLWRSLLAFYFGESWCSLPWVDSTDEVSQHQAKHLAYLLAERRRLEALSLSPSHPYLVAFRRRFGEFRAKLISDTFKMAIGKTDSNRAGQTGN